MELLRVTSGRLQVLVIDSERDSRLLKTGSGVCTCWGDPANVADALHVATAEGAKTPMRAVHGFDGRPEQKEFVEMMPKFSRVLRSLSVVIAIIGFAGTVQAASTFHFNANQTYLGIASGPFNAMAGSGNLSVENFEDGLVNTVGMSINRGTVRGATNSTDSVDRDDGNVDGLGRAGRSFTSGSHKSISISFANQGGNMPQMAGLVWTDGRQNSVVVMKAWDRNGNYLGFLRTRLGDLSRLGQTADDRFLGVTSEDGISRIELRSNFGGFEVDHVQFAYGMVAVPVPPALMMGVAGLLGAVIWRRRFMKSR